MGNPTFPISFVFFKKLNRIIPEFKIQENENHTRQLKTMKHEKDTLVIIGVLGEVQNCPWRKTEQLENQIKYLNHPDAKA